MLSHVANYKLNCRWRKQNFAKRLSFSLHHRAVSAARFGYQPSVVMETLVDDLAVMGKAVEQRSSGIVA
jgi:hypothetical protein